MTDMSVTLPTGRWALVGDGRMGRAIAAALPRFEGPFGRGFDGRAADGEAFAVVLLTVPDAQIASAAACIATPAIVGHCAGSLGMEVLAGHEAFGVHPLMTVTRGPTVFAGAGGAIAGTTARAVAVAATIAELLGLQTFAIADDDRVAYHTAASMASNFLIALEDAAEVMLRTAGADRSVLVPLVRASLENWAAAGATDALTGPIARGDEATVARQRAAVAARAPQLLAMFDVMCDRTRQVAGAARGSSPAAADGGDTPG